MEDRTSDLPDDGTAETAYDRLQEALARKRNRPAEHPSRTRPWVPLQPDAFTRDVEEAIRARGVAPVVYPTESLALQRVRAAYVARRRRANRIEGWVIWLALAGLVAFVVWAVFA